MVNSLPLGSILNTPLLRPAEKKGEFFLTTKTDIRKRTTHQNTTKRARLRANNVICSYALPESATVQIGSGYSSCPYSSLLFL